MSNEMKAINNIEDLNKKYEKLMFKSLKHEEKINNLQSGFKLVHNKVEKYTAK